MRFIRNDDDVFALRIFLTSFDLLVELLDQAEDIGLVLPQLVREVVCTSCPAGILIVVCQSAAGKGFVDLLIEIVAVGADQEGEIAAQFAMHFASEEHHGVGLAAALRVPEDSQFSLACFPVAHGLHGAVNTQELVVVGDDLVSGAGGIVEDDKVLEDIHEVGFVADTLEQRFHIHHAGIGFVETLPFVEVFELAGERAEFGVHAVAKHHDSVVMEEVRDGVFVVGEVLFVGCADIPVDVLEFHEQQGQSVDKADNVCPAMV